MWCKCKSPNGASIRSPKSKHGVQTGWGVGSKGAGSKQGRVKRGLLYPNQQCPWIQLNNYLYNNKCTCDVSKCKISKISVRVQSPNAVSVRSPKSKHRVQMVLLYPMYIRQNITAGWKVFPAVLHSCFLSTHQLN